MDDSSLFLIKSYFPPNQAITLIFEIWKIYPLNENPLSGQEEVRGEEVERRGALGLGHRGRQLRYLQVLLLFTNVPSLKS